MVANKGLIFKKVPNGPPVAGQDLTIEARDFDLNAGAPSGGVVLKNLYASFDPYQRGRMRMPEKKSYNQPFTLGDPITNLCIAKILSSSNDKFAEGDLVLGMLPIEQYTVLSTTEQVKDSQLRKLENPYGLKDITVFLGSLGMPGLTAYSSLYEIGKPKKGETIFVSAASGAVGQLVGQLAKHEGLKVIGSVGSDDKLDYILKELGFDGGFNYKKEKATEALPKLAPDGVDIYYENVGGEQLDAALTSMNNFGRIVACGMVSQYSAGNDTYGVKGLMQVVQKRLTMRGFIVFDENMGPLYIKEHQEKVGGWIKDGSFKVLSSTTDGIDHAAEGFVGMLEGKNFGKAVLKIQAEVSPTDKKPQKRR